MKLLHHFLRYCYKNSCNDRRELLLHRTKCTLYRDYYLNPDVPRDDAGRLTYGEVYYG